MAANNPADRPQWRQTMLRYFSAVQPSKTEADVDFALDNYDKPGSGGWPKMYADAINRFGPDPYQRTNSTTITTQQQGGTQWRNRLVSIYARYAPHKMDSVDQDLAAMQGNEENALRQLEEKYASLDAAHQTVSVNQQPSYNTVVIQNGSVSPPMVGIPSRTESVAIPQITITNNDGASSVQRQNYQNVQPQPEPQSKSKHQSIPHRLKPQCRWQRWTIAILVAPLAASTSVLCRSRLCRLQKNGSHQTQPWRPRPDPTCPFDAWR